jgi:hypothetical protein
MLDHFAPGNGLVSPKEEKNVEWYDYLYFSVVTEATLGYGDFAPLGLSRLVACTQVLSGILLAGMLVAKITSAAINRLTEISHAVRGWWVDIMTFPDGKSWLGVVEFVSDHGTIVFRGVNYDESGQRQHSFSCQLLYQDWPHYLTFRYEEAHEHARFGHGHTTVNFSDWRRGQPQCFQVTIEEKEKETRVSAMGWRLVEKRWLKPLKAPSLPPKFIQDLFAYFGPHLKTGSPTEENR